MGELALGYKKKTWHPESLIAILKHIFVVFNAMAELLNCSLFLKNLEQHRYFCNLNCKNTLSNTLKIYCNIIGKTYGQ